jgi:hypothetical protein
MVKADISRDDKSDQRTFGWVLTAVLCAGPIATSLQLAKGNTVALFRCASAIHAAVSDSTHAEKSSTSGGFDEEVDMDEIGGAPPILDHSDSERDANLESGNTGKELGGDF